MGRAEAYLEGKLAGRPDYEDMVADPAAMVRRITGFCGLQVKPVGTAEIGDDRGCAAGYSAHLSR